MIRRYFLLYFLVISLPFSLCLGVWQAKRYLGLQTEVNNLERAQFDMVEQNRRLIAEIVFYSSAERIENIAINELNLRRVQPEYVLQIKIDGAGHGL